MKKIIYTCDGCGRQWQWKYNIKAIDNQNAGNGMLLTVLNKQYCRVCLKKMITLFENAK